MKDKTRSKVSDILNEKDSAVRDEYYNQYVESITPTFSVAKNCFRAFIVGGIICTIGQGFIDLYSYFGAGEEQAKAFNTLTLVFIAVILTGLGYYQKLAKFAGTGSLVPITGFANSVAASAIEFKKEGQVFGIGCKIFVIAGPVILYGIFTSWLLGLIYYILQQFGIV